MVNIQESAVKSSKHPYFKTVFYKGVELFTHRDPNQQRSRLCLYDAESGWKIASGATRSEGRTEEELLQILESKLTHASQRGESFKNLISRLRRESPPKEEQQAIREAYVEATADSREPKSPRPMAIRRGMQPPVNNSTTTVAVPGDYQPRRDAIKMPVIKEQKCRCDLILHCGATAVPRVDVERVSTPRPTETWVPIPHVTLISAVEDSLRSTGLKIGNQVHSLTQDGARYFGMMEVHNGHNAEDYALIVGLRNSHDKSFPVGILAGSNILICDNLAWSGEIKIARKHTTNLMRDLPMLVSHGVGRLYDLFGHQSQRIEAYKNYRIRDKTAHDIVIRSFDTGAITSRMIPTVLKEWREPRHEVFREKSAWSLFNAFTETLKGNLTELPKRTQALHALFDTAVGLPAAHLN